jgi:hypothetical protein
MRATGKKRLYSKVGHRVQLGVIPEKGNLVYVVKEEAKIVVHVNKQLKYEVLPT